jgi:hypothetical protein
VIRRRTAFYPLLPFDPALEKVRRFIWKRAPANSSAGSTAGLDLMDQGTIARGAFYNYGGPFV